MPAPDYLIEGEGYISPCVYLPEQVACMPLCNPRQRLTPEQTDDVFERGYRRSGWAFYRTHCPACVACQPLRVDPKRFSPNRSQRRVLKRGDTELSVRIGRAVTDDRRVALFNLHRSDRQLAHDGTEIIAAEYRAFLVDSLVETCEISTWFENKLVAVSITDVGRKSLSAVYCYFDPAYSRFSLGTYSILKQWELAAHTGRSWLYLGMHVAANKHLAYKANFKPHEKLIDGRWQPFYD